MKKSNIPWDPYFYQQFSWYRDLYPINFKNFLQPSWPKVHCYNEYCHAQRDKIVNHQQQTIQFVPQYEKSKNFDDQYEPLIFLKGEVLSREESWHDFFNMLVWTRFPLSKATINAMQYHSLKYRHENNMPQRTPLENALTLFDENGVIILSRSPDLLNDIRNHAWKNLFWHQRAELNKLIVIIFGHAIYEKLLNPYTSITGHGLLFHIPEPLGVSTTDQLLNDYLTSTCLDPSNLQPFPLFGLPGAHAENAHEEFYDNKNIFRPKN